MGGKQKPVFEAKAGSRTYRMSKTTDLFTMQMESYRSKARQNAMSVATAYKRKADKVRPVNSSAPDRTVMGGIMEWREVALRRQKASIRGLPLGPYDHFLEPRYTKLARGARLKPERLERMIVGDIQPREREIFEAMLFNREEALAWEFSEMGRVSRDVTPPLKIKTVPHEAWQVPNFPVPRALREEVINMLRERLARGTLEYCESPYRNPWFLVSKKEHKKYRLINAAMNINRVTIRDANLPPCADEFSEEFAGCKVMSLVDFFSGYDQLELDVESRNLTAFATPLGLLRQTTVPMGGTNSVAQFVRTITKILERHIPHHALPFLDDITVKGPQTMYNGEESLPGVRRYILEHIVWLDGVLADLERAGCTISGAKSHFCKDEIVVVGYRCNGKGRYPEESKVAKIIYWRDCEDVTSARAFLGVVVYYRIWVEDFAIKAEPIFRLLRVNVPFVWGIEQIAAMKTLKHAITTAPALVQLDYSEGAGLIILAVDGCKNGWGCGLMQLDVQGRRHPCRFESGIWSRAEQKYDSGKLECRALLHALKKCRVYLYGVRFTVETDANTLVAQLNRAATDLPGALMTRWLAWIQLWDFDVRHVPGKKNSLADGLSRRPPDGERPDEPTEDIEEFIDCELSTLEYTASPVEMEVDLPLENSYSEESQKIAKWLVTLRRPEEMNTKEFKRFKRQALKFLVRNRQLFRRQSKNVPMRRVIDNENTQREIIKSLHDRSGHRGREGTYQRVSNRYWWPGLWDQISWHVKSCLRCQGRQSGQEEEAMHPTWESTLWQRVTVDITFMPTTRLGFRYLATAREYVSGWVEARALRKKDAKSVAKFLYEDVICRWGVFGQLSVDGGGENADITAALAELYNIKRVVASAYHPQGQGLIERGHKPIVDALAKMDGLWLDNLHTVLWADRTTVKRPTGMTPARVICGYEHVLPIELCIPTWQTLPWQTVRTTAELLALRAKQFDRRDADVKEAVARTRRLRVTNKEYFDDTHRIRQDGFKVGDMVMLHDTQLKQDYSSSRKLDPKWLGPFRVRESHPHKGWHLIEDLDGTPFRDQTPGNRLKKFYQRQVSEVRQEDRLDQSGGTMLQEMTAEPESEEDVIQKSTCIATPRSSRSTRSRKIV